MPHDDCQQARDENGTPGPFYLPVRWLSIIQALRDEKPAAPARLRTNPASFITNLPYLMTRHRSPPCVVAARKSVNDPQRRFAAHAVIFLESDVDRTWREEKKTTRMTI